MKSHQNSVWGHSAHARACTSQREKFGSSEAVEEEDMDEEVEVEEVGDGGEDDLEVESRRSKGKSPRRGQLPRPGRSMIAEGLSDLSTITSVKRSAVKVSDRDTDTKIDQVQ